MKKGIVVHHTGFSILGWDEKKQVSAAQKIFSEKYTYHFIILSSGTVLQGHSLSETVGHAANQKLEGGIDFVNRDYIGVAFMGDFTKDSWTISQLFGFSYIYQSLTRKHLLGSEILLHSEVSYTLCPGSLTKQILSSFLKNEYKELNPSQCKDCIQQGGKIYIHSRIFELLGLVSATVWDANQKKIIFFK